MRQLITTDPMPIIGNLCELPSAPIGGFIFNYARVSTDEGFEEHDDIELIDVDNISHLRFNDPSYDYTDKTAIVSYIGNV